MDPWIAGLIQLQVLENLPEDCAQLCWVSAFESVKRLVALTVVWIEQRLLFHTKEFVMLEVVRMDGRDNLIEEALSSVFCATGEINVGA
jgi:hypothetical protein